MRKFLVFMNFACAAHWLILLVRFIVGEFEPDRIELGLAFGLISLQFITAALNQLE